MNYNDYYSQSLQQLNNSPSKDISPLGTKAPLEATANALTGDFALENKDYAKAVEYFSKAITIDRENFYTYERRATGYFFLQDYTKAVESVLQSIQLESTFSNCKLAGECYLQMTDFSNAIKYFDMAIEKSKKQNGANVANEPEYKNALAVICNNRGISYFKKGDLANGIASANEGILYDPSYHNNHFIKAIMLMQTGKKTEAIASFRTAADLGNPNALGALSMIQ